MSDWRDLDDDPGEEVPSGPWRRMLRLGSMAARVGTSSMASKVRSLLPFGDEQARQERLQEAFRQNAQHVVDVLGQLKGASMKVGQLLSADPELLPDEFSDVIAQLQRDAPPMTYETVVRQIEESLGRDIDAIFSYFGSEPIGAASIGQVHRARLQSGEDVAVKIQYPGVVEALESDLKTLERLLVYGRVVVDRERLADYLDEVRDIVLKEADYENEAWNMADFADLLEDREGVRAPRPIERWTSRRVLTMEYADGEKIDEALAERSPDRRRAILKRWTALYAWLFHEQHYLHADPHPGNFLLEDDDTMWVLDFGCVKKFEPAFTDEFLAILVACWNDDQERALEGYRRLGFSTREADIDQVDPELLADYHEIILAPFLEEGPFDFSDWNPTMRAKKFMLRHPSFLRLVPPKDALLYFRVLSGIKGLLRKLDMTLDVRSQAEETARRRGLMP